MMHNEKLNRLQNSLADETVLIYDTKLIASFINTYLEVGERFIGLLISKTKIVLVLNRLFESVAPKGIEVHYYFDGDDIGKLIHNITTDTLYIDGNMPYRFVLELQKYNSIQDGSDLIHRVIAVKTAQEIEKMKISSHINDLVMEQVQKQIREGICEIELHDFIIAEFKRQGADDISFDPIVAFNQNCADPHAVSSERKLQKGDTVIVDMGCVKDGFCSDMTRSFLFHSEEYLGLYHIVLEAKNRAQAKIKPGVSFQEIDQTARDYIIEQGYGMYFNHRLGHGCGLAVHEPYDVSQATTRLVEENMIFSIEPGIYLPGQAGIRLEDLVVVTKDGYQSLNHYPFEPMIK